MRVTFDLAKLGLKSPVKAKDAVTGASMAINGDGLITLSMPSQDYRIIWVAADTAKAKP